MCPVVDKPAEQKDPARNEPGHDGHKWWAGWMLFPWVLRHPLLTKRQLQPTADGSRALTYWGGGVGGSKLQLVQGLPPGITGSSLGNFKISPTTELETPWLVGEGGRSGGVQS